MIKRIFALLLVVIMTATMFVGCDLLPTSVTMDKVTFKIGNETYKFYHDTISEIMGSSKVKCKDGLDFKELNPGQTIDFPCTFPGNGTTHQIYLQVINISDRKLKVSECVVSAMKISNDGVKPIMPAAIMGIPLSSDYTAFEEFFGKPDSTTENAGGNVYTWKNVPIKDSNYLVTIIVKDSKDDFKTFTSDIEISVTTH
jgi:hypothetical protein